MFFHYNYYNRTGFKVGSVKTWISPCLSQDHLNNFQYICDLGSCNRHMWKAARLPVIWFCFSLKRTWFILVVAVRLSLMGRAGCFLVWSLQEVCADFHGFSWAKDSGVTQAGLACSPFPLTFYPSLLPSPSLLSLTFPHPRRPLLPSLQWMLL